MPLVDIEGADVVECADGDTILRAALRRGVGFPYGCNVGACGNCRFQLVSGAVEHLRTDPPAWTDRDRERGRWLGCQARPLEDCRVQVRLDAAPAHRPVWMRGRHTEVRQITHDMLEFAFALEGPDDFLPGQYALFHLEGVEGARPYSMCNLPGSREWRFQIKRVPGGAATGWLFDDLRLDDTVVIDGPYGHGHLRVDRPGNLLLVAGGSGLSPMISIARAATTTAAFSDREIHFYFGGRQPHDLCAEPMLAELPGFGRCLTHVAAVSEPSPDWTGPAGFIHEVVRERLAERLAEFEVYFAGPPPMVKAMQVMLHEAGVGTERMHFDEFF